MNQIRLRSKKDAISHSSRVLKLELGATKALCESIGSPRALTVWLLIHYEQWDELLDLKCDPLHYNDFRPFMDDYQVTSMLQKNPRLPTGIDKRSVALRKFYDAEVLCTETNERIRQFREDPHSVGDFSHLVLRVQEVLQSIIGPFPTKRDLRVVEDNMRFGPGATTSISGVVTLGRKFSEPVLDCTKDVVDFRTFCFPYLWGQTVHELNIVRGSRLTTVPKNAKTDRCICIEPDLNVYIQLGIGAAIRERLRAFGLDLNDSAKNSELARRAYSENLATVDLSAASDTISYETVALLVPPAWCDLLELPRCASTNVDGSDVVLQKWSSMGNGYTFELESLIFYSVALAVTPVEDWDLVRTYGDDIIVPAGVYPDLVEALDFLGFRVNTEKTFGKGLFYESCGTDWFQGHNVRPFYLRSEHHDFESICYLYANNARRWANRRNGGWSCDSRCLPFWLRCFRAVEVKHRHRIPCGEGDDGFITDFDDAAPPRRFPRGIGWGGYWYTRRYIRAVERVVSQSGCLTAFLSGKCSDFSQGREALRGRYHRAVTKLGYSFEWPNLGPWL